MCNAVVDHYRRRGELSDVEHAVAALGAAIEPRLDHFIGHYTGGSGWSPGRACTFVSLTGNCLAATGAAASASWERQPLPTSFSPQRRTPGSSSIALAM